MVRAILNGSKTQTRRVVKWPLFDKEQCFELDESYGPELTTPRSPIGHLCPYGKPGDQIWVRENGWERPERTPKMIREGADTWEPYYYDADYYSDSDHAQFKSWGFKRRPSIHMPRWASRIQLEITGIRLERLLWIKHQDCIDEGVIQLQNGKYHNYFAGIEYQYRDGSGWCPMESATSSFWSLWESINGPGSWDANPWVWVVEFRRIARN